MYGILVLTYHEIGLNQVKWMEISDTPGFVHVKLETNVLHS